MHTVPDAYLILCVSYRYVLSTSYRSMRTVPIILLYSGVHIVRGDTAYTYDQILRMRSVMEKSEEKGYMSTDM